MSTQESPQGIRALIINMPVACDIYRLSTNHLRRQPCRDVATLPNRETWTQLPAHTRLLVKHRRSRKTLTCRSSALKEQDAPSTSQACRYTFPACSSVFCLRVRHGIANGLMHISICIQVRVLTEVTGWQRKRYVLNRGQQAQVEATSLTRDEQAQGLLDAAKGEPGLVSCRSE